MSPSQYTKFSILVRTDNEVLRYRYKGGGTVHSPGLVNSVYWPSLSVQRSGPGLGISTVYWLQGKYG